MAPRWALLDAVRLACCRSRFAASHACYQLYASKHRYANPRHRQRQPSNSAASAAVSGSEVHVATGGSFICAGPGRYDSLTPWSGDTKTSHSSSLFMTNLAKINITLGCTCATLATGHDLRRADRPNNPSNHDRSRPSLLTLLTKSRPTRPAPKALCVRSLKRSTVNTTGSIAHSLFPHRTIRIRPGNLGNWLSVRLRSLRTHCRSALGAALLVSTLISPSYCHGTADGRIATGQKHICCVWPDNA